MSYIIKNTNPFVSIKLTEKGREQLAQGKLGFSYWAIGDSELNYNREAIVDTATASGDVTLTGTSRIMRPFDRQPNFKSYITKSMDTTPYQTLTTANINVIKAVVNNEATERGFFTNNGTGYTTNSTTTFIANSQTILPSVLTGGTMLAVTSNSAMTVGDIILIKLTNDKLGNITPDENTRAMPNLWFKIESIPNSGVITVDRDLPNYTGYTALVQVLVYRGGEVYETIATGNTTSYWDSGTLAFDSASNVTCHDVPVWNMNNVWCEDLAGVTGLTTTYENYTKYGSYDYLGDKSPYLEYLCQSSATTADSKCLTPGASYVDEISKSISILHYTNNTISNLYGEFFYIDATNGKTVNIVMPDLMYHRRDYATASGTTMGMSFISSGSTSMVGDSDIEYMDLIEDPAYINSGATPMVIGRVYPQLKTIVIHDDEIVAAMSYKSNRNWTLPELSATLASPSGGTSTGILGIGKTMYVTYSIDNVGSTTGLTSSLPCQTYTKITNDTITAKDINFKINQTDELPYMRKYESTTYDGYGFYGKNFKLLYQIVDNASVRPDASSWKVLDYTSTAITSVSGQTIDPKLLENQTPTTNGFILDLINDASSSTFNLIPLLNMAPTMSPQKLQFGDERFFYGNLGTYIGATVYKTIFNIDVNAATYNTTSNITRSKDLTTNPPNIKISEVGIYDTDKNLVCVGKVSTPITLAANTITIELSMDF